MVESEDKIEMCKKINNGKYVILIGLYLYEYGTEIIILNKFFFREISVPTLLSSSFSHDENTR